MCGFYERKGERLTRKFWQKARYKTMRIAFAGDLQSTVGLLKAFGKRARLETGETQVGRPLIVSRGGHTTFPNGHATATFYSKAPGKVLYTGRYHRLLSGP